MFEEEKKKKSYGAIYLLCFFCCVFAVHFLISANPYTALHHARAAQPNGDATAYDPSHTSFVEINSSATKVSSAVTALRERPPSSYSLKIEAFSALGKANDDKYESRPFSSGGYNWTLIVYSKGNSKDSGSGYISLYVAIDNSSLVSAPHEVYADLRFFIYNKKERKYFTIQGT